MKGTTICMARITTNPLGVSHPRGLGTWGNQAFLTRSMDSDLPSKLHVIGNRQM
jgi:hypothetical protein